MVELKRVVRQAANGDEKAAGQLFVAYYPRVFRYALARLGHAPDAEDIAAETFARVLAELDRFRWKGAGFEGWLFRIAGNLVVDRVRQRQREQASDELEASEHDVERWTPEAHVLAGETAGELAALLVKLPPEQREILVLRFAAGLDTHEAGAVMNKKPNAIRQLQFRALENLRSMMPEGVAR